MTMKEIIKDMRLLWERGELQEMIALAYGPDGASVGRYGIYDADTARQLWKLIERLEQEQGGAAEPDPSLKFREVSREEHREIRARAVRQRRDGVVSELSARVHHRELTGMVGIVCKGGEWGHFKVGSTPEASTLLRAAADVLDRMRKTRRGRRRRLVWLRPRGPGGERFVAERATLEEFFPEISPARRRKEQTQSDEQQHDRYTE